MKDDKNNLGRSLSYARFGDRHNSVHPTGIRVHGETNQGNGDGKSLVDSKNTSSEGIRSQKIVY